MIYKKEIIFSYFLYTNTRRRIFFTFSRRKVFKFSWEIQTSTWNFSDCLRTLKLTTYFYFLFVVDIVLIPSRNMYIFLFLAVVRTSQSTRHSCLWRLCSNKTRLNEIKKNTNEICGESDITYVEIGIFFSLLRVSCCGMDVNRCTVDQSNRVAYFVAAKFRIMKYCTYPFVLFPMFSWGT